MAFNSTGERKHCFTTYTKLSIIKTLDFLFVYGLVFCVFLDFNAMYIFLGSLNLLNPCVQKIQSNV